MKKIIILLAILAFVSCKTKAVLAQPEIIKNNKSTDSLFQKYNQNNIDFSSLYIKANVKYQDDNQSQSVTADIKIQKNQKILISIRFLGITMAKALITPSSVQYYEKMGNNYFEGNYTMLSQWIGTDLDFFKVQNMLIGKALDDINAKKYNIEVVDNLFKLEDSSDATTLKAFYLEAQNGLVKKQVIEQPLQYRQLQLLYPNYKQYDQIFLPQLFAINANQNNKNTSIEVEYKSIVKNEELSFPYSVPEGYQQIQIAN
jgi:hypothetical protein